MSLAECYIAVDTERNKFFNSVEALRKHGETASFGGRGTEQKLIFELSVKEVGNEVGGTVPFGGARME